MRQHPTSSDSPSATASTTPESIANRQIWRARAMRDASAVRRAIRAARAGTNAVVGTPSTQSALLRGAVSELLVTRRFAGLDDATSIMMEQALAQGAQITPVTGVAELELDLVGNGVAALLRRTPELSDAG